MALGTWQSYHSLRFGLQPHKTRFYSDSESGSVFGSRLPLVKVLRLMHKPRNPTCRTTVAERMVPQGGFLRPSELVLLGTKRLLPGNAVFCFSRLLWGPHLFPRRPCCSGRGCERGPGARQAVRLGRPGVSCFRGDPCLRGPPAGSSPRTRAGTDGVCGLLWENTRGRLSLRGLHPSSSIIAITNRINEKCIFL